jgi:DegV family protein with EDD domain
MGSICILTDNAAQFTQPGFTGREVIRQISYSVRLNGNVYLDGEGPKSTTLPASTGETLHPALIVPEIAQIQQIFQSLAGQYREIIAILTSSELSPLFSRAEKAAHSVRGQTNLTLIDSQTTALGLGLMVQNAAEAAVRGMGGIEIERSIRRMIPRTYSIFASSGLSYMYHAGFIDEGQAAIGEMLGILPIFSLEEGKLSSIEKARNPRGVLEFFQEFLGEFDDLQQIAFLHGAAPFNQEAHLLREHAQIHFAHTPFTEHTINLPTAMLFGPRTLGLVILEGE